MVVSHIYKKLMMVDRRNVIIILKWLMFRFILIRKLFRVGLRSWWLLVRLWLYLILRVIYIYLILLGIRQATLIKLIFSLSRRNSLQRDSFVFIFIFVYVFIVELIILWAIVYYNESYCLKGAIEDWKQACISEINGGLSICYRRIYKLSHYGTYLHLYESSLPMLIWSWSGRWIDSVQ